MSEVKIFECDVTGERFGAKNDVIEFELRWARRSPFEVTERQVHIALDALPEGIRYPPHLKYLGVEGGKIVGMCNGWYPRTWDDIAYEYTERDDVTIDHHEPFFQFVEEEVLY